jgi:hypothetical protein
MNLCSSAKYSAASLRSVRPSKAATRRKGHPTARTSARMSSTASARCLAASTQATAEVKRPTPNLMTVRASLVESPIANSTCDGKAGRSGRTCEFRIDSFDYVARVLNGQPDAQIPRVSTVRRPHKFDLRQQSSEFIEQQVSSFTNLRALFASVNSEDIACRAKPYA